MTEYNWTEAEEAEIRDRPIPEPPDWHKIKVHRMATETIAEMHKRVQDLGIHYGVDHKWTTDAMQSLVWNLSQLFGMFFGSESTITKDSDLSLFVQTSSGFVYGMIFHRVYRHCTTCGVTQGYETYAIEDHRVICGRDKHSWDYGEDQPVPGTWSFHS